MIEAEPKSAHVRIVEEYFRTTSASGTASSDDGFDESLTGLRRRLGPWCDVRKLDVVDLGSGTGELCALALREEANSVVGVNMCMAEIEYARSRVPARFVHGDVVEFLEGLQPSSVDCIFALNILEHLETDAALRTLEAAYRSLRPGGRVVAMVPNATSPFGSMTRYWDLTHRCAFTPSSVRQMSRLAGFGESVEFRECGPVPYALKSRVRFALWQVIRTLIRAYLMVELASDKGGVYTVDMLFRLTKRAVS